jgi:hypothetical protein
MIYPPYPYSGYDGILDWIRKFKDKDRIVSAFKSVWGRPPTDTEISLMVKAIDENKRIWGARLKDRVFVSYIQEALQKAGIPVKKDGIFYYQTIAGIMKLQQIKGMRVTGILDQATFSILKGIMDVEAFRSAKPNLLSSGVSTDYTLLVGAGILGAVIIAYFLTRRR